MADKPFPTNAATAAVMWGLLAVGVALGAAADSIAVMIVFALIGVVIHSAGLVQDAE